jgi:hypothetical protein
MDMERPGKLPGGVISDVRNVTSGKAYIVSTAPEIGQDYWSTAVMPVIEKRMMFGLLKRSIPDVYHQIASLIRIPQKMRTKHMPP